MKPNKGLAWAQGLQVLGGLINQLSPEERQKRKFTELEYKVKTAQYNHLLQHPELLGSKDALAPYRRDLLIQQAAKYKAEAEKLNNPGASSFQDEAAQSREFLKTQKLPGPPPLLKRPPDLSYGGMPEIFV